MYILIKNSNVAKEVLSIFIEFLVKVFKKLILNSEIQFKISNSFKNLPFQSMM